MFWAWRSGSAPSVCNLSGRTISSQALSGTTNGAHICLFPERRVFIKQIELRELRMRLLHPFETSFGATQDRHILLVKISDGTHAGWGEVTAAEGPFYSYETYETAWHVLRDYIVPKLAGKEIGDVHQYKALIGGFRGHNMAKAGIETALWDLDAKMKTVPLWKMLGGERER